MDKPIDNSVESGPIEENPEYALIVQANNLSVEVDNELLLVHKVFLEPLHPSPLIPDRADLWDPDSSSVIIMPSVSQSWSRSSETPGIISTPLNLSETSRI